MTIKWGIYVQCGAKYFDVKMVINNEVKETSVTARDQIAARKTIRSHYGDSAHILTVREKRINRGVINE